MMWCIFCNEMVVAGIRLKWTLFGRHKNRMEWGGHRVIRPARQSPIQWTLKEGDYISLRGVTAVMGNEEWNRLLNWNSSPRHKDEQISNHSVSIFSCEAKAISEKQDTSILRSEGGERRRAVGLSVELSSAYIVFTFASASNLVTPKISRVESLKAD